MSNHNILTMVSVRESLSDNNAERVLCRHWKRYSIEIYVVLVEGKRWWIHVFRAIFVYCVETLRTYLDGAVEIYLRPYYTPKLLLAYLRFFSKHSNRTGIWKTPQLVIWNRAWNGVRKSRLMHCLIQLDKNKFGSNSWVTVVLERLA